MLEQVVNGVAFPPSPMDASTQSLSPFPGQTPPLEAAAGEQQRLPPPSAVSRRKGSARSATDNLLRQSMAALGEALSAARESSPPLAEPTGMMQQLRAASLDAADAMPSLVHVGAPQVETAAGGQPQNLMSSGMSFQRLMTTEETITATLNGDPTVEAGVAVKKTTPYQVSDLCGTLDQRSPLPLSSKTSSKGTMGPTAAAVAGALQGEQA